MMQPPVNRLGQQPSRQTTGEPLRLHIMLTRVVKVHQGLLHLNVAKYSHRMVHGNRMW
jgi:hypothetical protein